MEEILKAGYTLTLSGEYGNISGGYLKKTSQGIHPIWRFPEEEVKIVESFSNVFSILCDSKILQLYYTDGSVVAMIGEKHFELPYAEREYLAVEGISYGSSAILALENLNSQLKKKIKKLNSMLKHISFMVVININ